MVEEGASPRSARAKALVLFIKGMCMGIADVIPGVSGGTMALILGIYREFIDGIRSVDHKPLAPLLAWVFSGFSSSKKAPLVEALGRVHLRFLIPLVAGIVIAIGVGSAVIPSLLERFPELMRGLFFGLIVASIYIPFKMMPKDNKGALVVAGLLGVAFAFGGYAVTDPNALVDTTSNWVEVTVPETDEPMILKDAIRRGPSAMTPEQVYWTDENAPLRATVAKDNPELAAQLEEQHNAALGAVASDKHAAKERSVPYNDIVVPAGTVIKVPRPGYGFIFLAGAIAICAMVLPGISGSFLLLILGCYYFVLNALKGSLKQLVALELPVESLTYLALFISGILVGIATFSRLLSWLLEKYPAATMGALVGLMVGCLRGIWPYQQVDGGQLTNVLPASWGTMEIGAVIMAVVGIGLVVVMTVVGARLEAKEGGA